MTRHPWPDTMPVDRGAEALIARLAAGGRRPMPLPPHLAEAAAQRYRDVQGDDVPTERYRSGAWIGLVLLLCSAGLVIACAVGVIAMVRP